MAFTKEEIIGKDRKWEDVPKEHQDNILELMSKLNKVRYKWGKPMITTSGYRYWADHVRIYKQKAEREGKVFDESTIPKGSKHLFGLACDIYDPELKLTKWLKNNPKILEEIGLWCEEGNSNWVHFQIRPPKSGNRWFLP